MEIKLPTEIKGESLDKEWDVIIIGGGPAGYSAGLYCGRYKLKTLIITKEIGGLLNEIHIIDDYPGILESTGPDLAKKFREHAERYGVKTLIDEVVFIDKKDNKFIVKTLSNGEFYSKAIIVATGSQRKKLGVPGENLKGVSYCGECDAPLFKDKTVGVVGGGDAAFHDAMVLAEHASKVYIIHRRDEFRAQPVLVEEAKKNSKIEFLLNKVVIEIRGKDKVEEVVLQDTKTGEKSTLKLDGLFIAIGLAPVTEFVKNIGVELNQAGNIVVDECARTNVPGVLAAGDVTQQLCNLRQVITASAQGVIAALSAFKYIKTGQWK